MPSAPKISLVDLSATQSSDFLRWISDKESVKYSLSLFQPDRDISWVTEFIEQLEQDSSSWNQAILINNVAVGYCGLSNMSVSNRSAEYFILIGDRQYWNMGIGTQAGKEVLSHAFCTLGLHRVWLTVSEHNKGAIRCYEKLCFKHEGRMREACLRDGRYHDKLVMSILESDAA